MSWYTVVKLQITKTGTQQRWIHTARNGRWILWTWRWRWFDDCGWHWR